MKIRKSKIYINMFVGSSAHTCEQTDKRSKGLSVWYQFSPRELEDDVM